MVSQMELYEFLKKDGGRYTTKELMVIFNDRHIGTKLRQLLKFRFIQAENIYSVRMTKWWVKEDD